ncbi:hypothetical protein SKAU_G00037730 [Synaphobranchus kaupii]|uniref:Caspase recruitment domain-containing protein n=1 Tax=Synaphobranchus kaupii TaxID=118154 RepID=A0A9Q1JG69_SYNKA|nr:hypothetical protein SKAU_G00037730 [Synaphobranchus kaupii]
MYDFEKEQLTRFKDYIVQILRPSYIERFMSMYLETEMVERILAEEKTSVTSAAQMLLQNILGLEETGWFQAFLDELQAQGYSGLRVAILEWDFKNLEDMRFHKDLLNIIESAFTREIKPFEIVTYMSECFSPRECEEIRAVTEQKGQIAENNGKEVDDMEENGETTTLSIVYREETCANANASANDLAGSLNQMGLTENQTEQQVPVLGRNLVKSPENESSEPIRKSWQYLPLKEKIALSALLQAVERPIVALAICEHHMKTKADQKPKIVFMATKVDVFEQQYNLFKDHFNKIDDDVRITGLCGDMGEQISMDIIAEANDIIILTPQILVNAPKPEGPTLTLRLYPADFR